MAQILSSEVLSDRPQADGRRYIRVVFHAEDHDQGTKDVYVGPSLRPSDFDEDAWMLAQEDDVLEGLAQEEDQGGLDVNDVADPLVYAFNPKWSTSKRIAKVMIYWMMEERDIRIVIYLKPLIEYLQDPGNYTPTQLKNFLDITTAQLQRLNRRVSAILSDTGTCVGLVADFDTEEGEF